MVVNVRMFAHDTCSHVFQSQARSGRAAFLSSVSCGADRREGGVPVCQVAAVWGEESCLPSSPCLPLLRPHPRFSAEGRRAHRTEIGLIGHSSVFAPRFHQLW